MGKLKLLLLILPILSGIIVYQSVYAQISISDRDGDGIPDSEDKCPSEPENFNGFEDTDGCPDTLPDRDGDGIPDSEDKCPSEPENFNGFEDTDGCPDDPRGPTKTKVSAEKRSNTILVKWETPIDTVENIKYNYKVLRSVNLGNYNLVFDSTRTITEKTLDKDGEEQFFFLDQKTSRGNNYTYQVVTEDPVDLQIIVSDPSNTVTISEQIISSKVTAKAYLISGRILEPIKEDTEIIKISWLDWLLPNFANAEIFVDSTFTTTLNPQSESYRLKLEPIPAPNGTNICDDILQFSYTRDQENGQNFEVLTSIFEIETITDDYMVNGTTFENSTQVETLRHQKLLKDFTPTEQIKAKWFNIHPENKTVQNYTNLEIQFDVTAETEIDPLEHRKLNFWDIFFIVPMVDGAC